MVTVTGTCNATLLLIKWVSMSATNSTKENTKAFSTNYETNVLNFQIEKSINGVKFDIIQTINATGNASSTLQNYSYNDVSPQNINVVYYRIKQIDSDGRYSCSNIVKVNAKKTKIPFYKF